MLQMRWLGSMAILGALLVPLGGCPQPTPPAATLPAGLQSVVNAAADFADLSARVQDTTPTDITSASDVDGCWAQVESQIVRDVDQFGDVLLEVFEVYQFDAATQSARYELLIRDDTEGPDVVMVARGTFSVPEAGQIHLVFDQWAGNDPGTGQLTDIPDAETLDTSFAAQLANGALVLTPEEDLDDANGMPDPIVFGPLACPA